ncbi:MAG: deoxyribose-phosphate aldolase [Butyrivibrio sp.]|nr:deoxyribose-phosphate aldolase [Butyrivibrio sp.]
MDMNELLAKCDHTLLKQSAKWEDIRVLCDEGMDNGCMSVCIPPSYVKQAYEYLRDKETKLKICTVIGFPNGYNTTRVKVLETEEAVLDGADEIDMVINIGWLKDKRDDEIVEEIKAVKKACHGRLLKVIIETCLLTQEEKMTACKLVTKAGADYIKTSTGFSTGGATPQDVALLKANVGKNVKVKAAGGIASLEDADLMLKLGASRLGTSKVVALYKQLKNK